MTETIEITLFSFAELSEEAKAKAREWYRDGALDYDWHAFVYEDFEAICALIGVSLKTSNVRLMGGGTRQKPNIYFRGFWNQGDGACFEGQYRYKKRAGKAIRAYAPSDEMLHRIVDNLASIQRRNFYQLSADCRHRGHYYHEYCMVVAVDRNSPAGQDVTADAEEAVKEALRDLARWLYRQLERDYEYLNSDSAIDEAILANAYRFTEDGGFHD